MSVQNPEQYSPIMRSPEGRMREPRRTRSPLMFGAIVVVILALMIGAYLFRSSSTGIMFNRNETNLSGEELRIAVGRIVLLPEGEVPMTATVTEPEKLQSQPFFVRAIVGDKVLIFPVSQKAILYRPSTEQIVEMMPFTVPPDIAATAR